MSTPSMQYLPSPRQREAVAAPAVRVASMAILIVGTMAIWWPTFGSRTAWILPTTGLGIALATHRLPIRPSWRPALTIACWFLWTPLVMLLTGQSISSAFPSALGRGVASLVQSPGDVGDASAFAAWLTLAGGCWLVGADLAGRPGRGSAATAFFALAIPFAVAIPLLSHSGGAAWEGGAVLVAALLWATRGDLRGTLPALAAVGVIAAITAAVIGPTGKWESLDRARSSQSGAGGGAGNSPRGSSGGSALNTNQTYGPIKSDFTGATLLEIDSDRPALWRMQTLDTFNGSGWVAGSAKGDELPQPSVVGTTIGVQIDALRDRRVMSPGRVIAVSGAGTTHRTAGEAVELDSPTSGGQRFSVTAQFVRASTQDLSTRQIPTGDQYARYTAVFPANQGIPTPVTSVANRLTPQFAATELGETIRIAKQLSNASTELGVVTNVENYLKSPTFRYSLDVQPAGNNPILDFLTKTHVGYCQHFAGAAALLLRMAGVPTRLAVGFATGTTTGNGVYSVADKDAHAWIEVYFAGVGWVPFNPTPPGAAASIGAGVDVVSPKASGSEASVARPRAMGGDGSTIGIVLIVVLAVGCVYWWRRARRGAPIPPLGDVLLRLMPPPADAATTHVEIRGALAKLGPSLEALAAEAERQRFGVGDAASERHPYRRMWRALIRDVGMPRALRLMLIGPPRPLLTDGVARGAFQQIGDAKPSYGTGGPIVPTGPSGPVATGGRPPLVGVAPGDPVDAERSVAPPPR